MADGNVSMPGSDQTVSAETSLTLNRNIAFKLFSVITVTVDRIFTGRHGMEDRLPARPVMPRIISSHPVFFTQIFAHNALANSYTML